MSLEFGKGDSSGSEGSEVTLTVEAAEYPTHDDERLEVSRKSAF